LAERLLWWTRSYKRLSRFEGRVSQDWVHKRLGGKQSRDRHEEISITQHQTRRLNQKLQNSTALGYSPHQHPPFKYPTEAHQAWLVGIRVRAMVPLPVQTRLKSSRHRLCHDRRLKLIDAVGTTPLRFATPSLSLMAETGTEKWPLPRKSRSRWRRTPARLLRGA
jgi:hypothetical protein